MFLNSSLRIVEFLGSESALLGLDFKPSGLRAALKPFGLSGIVSASGFRLDLGVSENIGDPNIVP